MGTALPVRQCRLPCRTESKMRLFTRTSRA